MRVRPIVRACLTAAALFVTSPAAPAAQEPYVPRTLQPAELAPEIALLRQALEEVHAGWDRYMPRRVLDTAFARLNRRAAAPMTELEYYRDVALLLARLRCDHTKAELPASLDRYRREQPTFLPVRLRVLGDRLYVVTGAGIARGTELRAINGIASKNVIARLSRYVAVDGFTDFARAARLESDDDLLGNDLDHYWPFEYGFATSWTLTLVDAAGRERTETHAPITYAAWRRLDGDGAVPDFRTGTLWRALDDTTALLTVRSFVNYRTPVDADSLYGATMRAITAAGVRHLIVDLRENGGGSSDASWGLVRHVIGVPVTPVRAVRRRTIAVSPALLGAFETWGDARAIFAPDSAAFEARADGWFVERGSDETLTPARDAFTGRVSLLSSRHISSGTTMLLAVLQASGQRDGRIRVVGEETGGSAEGPTAGQILFLRLPASGVRVRVPLKRSDVNAPFVTGMGVFPDVDATEDVADLRAGRDRALLVAMRQPWTAPATVLAQPAGVLRGVLIYRDYTSGKRVTLPTVQHVAPIGTSGAVRARVIYDDGPGNTIYGTEVMRLSGRRVILGGADETPDTLTITSRRKTADGTVLVLRGRGMDDNRPVEFRYTWTVGPSVFTRLKEFRAPGTQAWQYRHVYEFRREGLPAAR